jgi:head-tail adaptor
MADYNRRYWLRYRIDITAFRKVHGRSKQSR